MAKSKTRRLNSVKLWNAARKLHRYSNNNLSTIWAARSYLAGDKELIDTVIKNDKAALTSIINRYNARINRVEIQHEPRDQDVSIKVLLGLKHFMVHHGITVDELVVHAKFLHDLLDTPCK